MRNAYNILVGKHEEKTPLRKPDIRMDLKGTGGGNADWMHLAQDGYQWRTAMNTVLGSIKGEEFD
jgi:hypothetical protein